MPRVKTFREEEVLEKAMEVFWKNGFHATSMQELVEHMGINRASLYDTFGCKEALFERAFEQYRLNNQKMVKDFLQRQQSVREGLFRLYEKAIDVALGDPDSKGCFVVNTTAEFNQRDEAIKPLLAANKADFELLFVEYLQKGVDSGEIDARKDLPAIATFLYTLYSGLMLLSRLHPNREELLTSVRSGLSILD